MAAPSKLVAELIAVPGVPKGLLNGGGATISIARWFIGCEYCWDISEIVVADRWLNWLTEKSVADRSVTESLSVTETGSVSVKKELVGIS